MSAAIATEAKISAKDVTKIYQTKKNSFQALEHVSFDVFPHEFVSFVGASGCGKSTLLRILAGLEEITTGSIQIAGSEINGPGADRGMVFQSYTLFPWLNVRQNIEFGLTLQNVPLMEKRRISEHFMEMVSLQRFATSFPKELSGGMKQRVAIARALANKPEVLLMDEPFGALDPMTKGTMQEMLLDIWKKEKMTVIFITHDIEEAIFLSERVYVMDAHPGRIKQEVIIPATLKKEGKDSAEFIQLKKQIVALIGPHD
jgi:NitT/TauT family transport system ATP-binding protein